MSTKTANTAAKTNTVATAPAKHSLQRQCACGNHIAAGGECASCATKKLQKKLSIGATNDPLELEADRVADQVLAYQPAHSFSNISAPKIQRRAEQLSPQTEEVPASVERVLAGSGSPLPITVRKDMEQRFGQDFSQVRMHTGSAAEQSASDVNANAYTAGNNIVFNRGRFSPETQNGKRLLAHELTHVVQQSNSDKANSAGNEVSGPVTSLKSAEPVVQRAPLTEAEAQRRIAEIESIIANSSQTPETMAELESERNRLANFLRAPISRPAPASRPARTRPSAVEPSAAEERAQRSDPVLHDIPDSSSVPENGSSLEMTVPRPEGLPSGGYTLYQVIGAPQEFLQSIPENRITTIDMSALAANDRAAPGVSPGVVGTPMAGAGASSLLNSSRALVNGFIPTTNAIGLVSYPSSGNLSLLELAASIGPRNGVTPGHTAMVIVRNGHTSVVGFKTASFLETLANYRGLFKTGEGAASSIPAQLTNDIGIFRNPTARQVMWDISPEALERIRTATNPEQMMDDVLREVAPGNPSTSAVPEGGFTEYTGRPAELGRANATNCVGWACNAIEQRVGEAPRARMRSSGVVEPIVPEGGGTRLQGRMMQATTEGAADTLAGVAPRAAGMSRTMQFMRIGGRVFLVVGVVISAVEVGRAVRDRDYRRATQEVGGFATGFAAGAAAGLLCGPGAPVCSIGLGLVFGLGGYFAGRAIAGAAYDAAATP
jgi:Domain of unknown function (DUF4157)